MANILNPDLLSIARTCVLRKAAMDKEGFVPPADAAGGPAADPMAGAMPPMPAMGGGGDPAGGAAPPPEGSGGGGVTAAEVQAIVQQALSQSGGAAGAGGMGAEPIKPKIDVNVELMQIKNLLAKITDALGLQVPAQDMVATPDKLTAMAQGQSTATPAGGAGPGSAIGSIEPMPGASPALAAGGGGGGSKSATERGREFPRAEVEGGFEPGGQSKVATKAAALAARIRAAAKVNGHAVQGV